MFAALPASAPAQGSDFERIFEDYRADGEIDPCKYTDKQLRNAEDQVPPDIEQYAPGFLDALRTARERRARGECDKKTTTTPGSGGGTAPPGASGGSGAPGAAGGFTLPDPPEPDSKDRTFLTGVTAPSDKAPTSGGAGAPTLVLVLGIAAGIAGLIGLIAALFHFMGWSPDRFTRPFRSAATEAGMKSSDLAADFRDWVRFGR